MRKIFSLLFAALMSATMFANSYWFAGSSNGWTGAAMTVSTKGNYEYIQIAKQDATLSFKIQTAEGSWDNTLGRSYNQAGFAGTNVTNMNSGSSPWGENGSEGSDGYMNCCIYFVTEAFYVIVFKPSTEMNTSANPIICASTTLPSETEPIVTKYYLKNNWEGGEWTWKEMTKDGDNYKLENVVFGGSGVNYNTAAAGDGTWVAVADFLGATIGALDTVTLVLAPNATPKATITATLLGKYVAKLPNGYYLLGSINSWKPAAGYMFTKLTDDPEEYKLENVTLAVGDEIKAAYAENDAAKTWYGSANYTVDADHAGTHDVYFRPAGNSPDWDEFGGYIWMGSNGGGTAIDNTAVDAKATKVLRNGMLFIEKDGKTYNVLGTVVR